MISSVNRSRVPATPTARAYASSSWRSASASRQSRASALPSTPLVLIVTRFRAPRTRSCAANARRAIRAASAYSPWPYRARARSVSTLRVSSSLGPTSASRSAFARSRCSSALGNSFNVKYTLASTVRIEASSRGCSGKAACTWSDAASNTLWTVTSSPGM